MPQPIQFYDGINVRIPRVDENGYIILSPTSVVGISGTIDLSGASIDVDVPHYVEGTATSAADGMVFLGKKTSNSLAAILIDESRRSRVVVEESTLPSGAATAANQSTANGFLGTLAGAIVGGQYPITAASLPLPSGAATAANQTTGNGFLGTLASIVSSSKAQVDIITMPTATVAPVVSNSVSSLALTVTTAVVTLAAAYTGRKSIVITNNSGGNLYVGETSTVAASGANTGILVPAFSTYTDSGHGVYTGQLFGIYSTAMTSINVSIRDRG